MVDNVTLNSGSGGDVIGADDIAGVKYQRVKVIPGGDGSAPLNGCVNTSYLSAAAANQDSTHPKASSGVLYGLTVTNSNTSARYIKLYNLASGATSASTVWRRYLIPAGGGLVEKFPHGVEFSVGLGLRLTTGAADNDANAVASAEIMVNLEWV